MALNDFFIKRLNDNFRFVPTNGQKDLFNALGNFLNLSNKDSLLLVTGYAGTGKTSSVNALIKTMREFKQKFVLLAPTGRAAKVLGSYTGWPAQTIHKQIYRQQSMDEGGGRFSLDFNKAKDTIYIIDEASLISPADSMGNSIFGSGNVLEDVISYIKNNGNNKLILIGDPAQLPPIGLDRSPALDPDYINNYIDLFSAVHLTDVVRQEKESGILANATMLRSMIEREMLDNWNFLLDGYDDIKKINGGELIETLSDAIDKWGSDEVVVLCRSNKRANKYNAGIRDRILYKEEALCKGDRLMVVKNCYRFVEENKELDFIANGDVGVLQRIWGYEERYGLHFANAELSFPDYNNIEITCKIITDTLTSESPSLGNAEQKLLFNGVVSDYSDISVKKKRMKAVREDAYYNALQVKHAMAITGHKSQGGQWKCVFVDNNLWSDTPSLDDLKWLYTAITRGVEKVYLVNFTR